MVSTSEVLDRHLKSFAEYDVDGVVADYSSNAVLFAPSGPLKGPAAIRPLFEALISEFAKPGSSFTMQLQCIEGDHAYILWTAETPDNSYEFATKPRSQPTNRPADSIHRSGPAWPIPTSCSVTTATCSLPAQAVILSTSIP
jgi:hypothetical protein